MTAFPLRAFLLTTVVCASCGGSPAPASAIGAFSTALRDRRIEDAYGMLSLRYRERVSLTEFRDRIVTHPEVVEAAVESLRALGSAPTLEAEAALDRGERIALTPCGEMFCIATDLVDLYDQSTPRAALTAFVRAAENGRFDVLLRLTPDADLEDVSEEKLRALWQSDARDDLERTFAALRTAVGNPIEELGTRATMRYAEGKRVELVQENGKWKIARTE